MSDDGAILDEVTLTVDRGRLPDCPVGIAELAEITVTRPPDDDPED